MLHDFVAKRLASAEVTLRVDLFAAEVALRRALAPLVDASAAAFSFETQILAEAQASRSTGGFERRLSLTFNSIGERDSQVAISAIATPPIDSTRRFRRYRVPRAVDEMLRADTHALRSHLADVVPAGGADRVRFHSRFLTWPTETTLRVSKSRPEAAAAARVALGMLPAYVETKFGSSTGTIDLPTDDGSHPLSATLVQREDVTEISLRAGAKPEGRQELQRRLDRIAGALAESSAG